MASACAETLLKAFLGGSGYCDCWDKDGLLSVACMRGLCTHTQTYTYTYTYIYLYIYILSVACMRGLCTQYTDIYIYIYLYIYILSVACMRGVCTHSCRGSLAETLYTLRAHGHTNMGARNRMHNKLNIIHPTHNTNAKHMNIRTGFFRLDICGSSFVCSSLLPLSRADSFPSCIPTIQKTRLSEFPQLSFPPSLATSPLFFPPFPSSLGGSPPPLLPLPPQVTW